MEKKMMNEYELGLNFSGSDWANTKKELGSMGVLMYG